MKIVKRILIGLLSIIAIALIAALFLNKDYAVEREVEINKPKQQVFDYIKLLKNQDNFSVWAKKDPLMKKTYTGTDGTVGFISAWESDTSDVGAGAQQIKKIAEGVRLDFEIRFKKPFEATDYAYMITESVSDAKTKVKWGFKGSMPYPMNLMLVFMNMEKMLAPDLQNGLENLKGILEKM